MHKTFASEKASIHWWPIWYKADKVVATMHLQKEEFIAEAVKIERWS